MQHNPVEQKVTDEEEVEAKVLACLADCGLDTHTISVHDIDSKSLAFLSQWADKNSDFDELQKLTSLNDTIREVHELQDMDYEKEGRVLESNNGESPGAEIQEAKSQKQNVNEPAISLNQTSDNLRSLLRTQMELDRTKLLISSLQAMKDTKQPKQAGVATTHNVENDDLDLNELEPWQQLLFRKMDKQTQAIERCQNEIHALANIVSLQIVTANESSAEPSVTRPRGTPSIQPPNASNAELQPSQVPLQAQLQNHPQAHPVLTIADKIFDIPRKICAYTLSTRPIRVLYLVKREAINFKMGNPNQPFIDYHLMIKLSFICMFLRSRIGSNARRGGGRKLDQNRKGESLLGEMMDMWRMRSPEILIVSSVIVYFIQTGLIVFFYNIIFKENVIAKVWRDEDLQEVISNTGSGDENDIDEARAGNALRREEPRRGRRDRRPLGANAENPENVREGDIQGQEGQAQEPFVAQIRANFQPNINLDDTFVGGVMDPPFHLNGDEERIRNAPREEIFLGRIIDGMKDVFYLFGSFFLSFFPMWRLRIRAVVREDRNIDASRDEQEQIGGGEVAQDEDDGAVQDVGDENNPGDAPNNNIDRGADEPQG